MSAKHEAFVLCRVVGEAGEEPSFVICSPETQQASSKSKEVIMLTDAFDCFDYWDPNAPAEYDEIEMLTDHIGELVKEAFLAGRKYALDHPGEK